MLQRWNTAGDDVRCTALMSLITMALISSLSSALADDKIYALHTASSTTAHLQPSHLMGKLDETNRYTGIDSHDEGPDRDHKMSNDVKRSTDVFNSERSNLRKVFLGRKRYFDGHRQTDDDIDQQLDTDLGSMIAGLGERYPKRPRPFLGKRSDIERVSSQSWLPIVDDEQEIRLPAEAIGKRPHSKPFLGKRFAGENEPDM